MTQAQIEKNFLLLTAELDTLKVELRVAKNLNEEALRGFNLELQKHISPPEKQPAAKKQTPDSATRSIGKDTGPQDFVETKKSSRLMKSHKGLFKQIASVAHPDKNIEKDVFERQHYTAAFEKVNAAFLDEDIHEVYSIAKSLDIEVPKPTMDDLRNFVSTRDRLSKQINSIKTSYPWVWFMADEESTKEQILQKYLATAKK